jgi:hypothetical protein
MEKYILGIIKSSDNQNFISTKITEQFKLFYAWSIENVYTGHNQSYGVIDDNGKEYNTIDSIFEYWKDEVKK